jgi:isocitrate dehydrogenase (NAD+)
MFEAIHGSAPRMVKEGRAKYADPSSLLRAGAMMLEHVGYERIGLRLHKALDICGQYERRVVITGRDTGATSEEFGDYVMATVEGPSVEDHWNELVMST